MSMPWRSSSLSICCDFGRRQPFAGFRSRIASVPNRATNSSSRFVSSKLIIPAHRSPFGSSEASFRDRCERRLRTTRGHDQRKLRAGLGWVGTVFQQQSHDLEMSELCGTPRRTALRRMQTCGEFRIALKFGGDAINVSQRNGNGEFVFRAVLQQELRYLIRFRFRIALMLLSEPVVTDVEICAGLCRSARRALMSAPASSNS